MTNAPTALIADDPEATQAPEPPVDPAALEAAARQHLDATRARLEALSQRASERQQQITALVERQRDAVEAAERASAAAAAYPGDLATARARVLIASSQPSRTSLQREVERLQAEQEDAAEAVRAATEAVARCAHEAHTERVRLADEAEQEDAERVELEALVPALVAEVAAAHNAAGVALLERLQAEQRELEAARTDAEAKATEAQAALERHQAEVRATLAPYPDALRSAREASLLPPEGPGVVERLLVPYLAYLRTLQTCGRFADMPVYDHVPVSNILGGLTAVRLNYALQTDPATIAPHVRYVEQLLADLEGRRRRGGL